MQSMTRLRKCTVGPRSSAMHRLLVCLLATIAATSAAGVYGGVNFDPNSAGFQGQVVFPKIPGINAPLFPPRSEQQQQQRSPFGGLLNWLDPFGIFRPRQNQPPSQPSFPSFKLPNVRDLIPQIPSNFNSTDLEIPGFPDFPPIPPIPGLQDAILLAREHLVEHLNTTLGIGNNLIDGIQQAIEEAFNSNDPTAALRTLVTTILDTYLAVARNCPAFVIGFRVLQEGIRLSGEVAKSVQNVLIGRRMNQ